LDRMLRISQSMKVIISICRHFRKGILGSSEVRSTLWGRHSPTSNETNTVFHQWRKDRAMLGIHATENRWSRPPKKIITPCVPRGYGNSPQRLGWMSVSRGTLWGRPNVKVRRTTPAVVRYLSRRRCSSPGGVRSRHSRTLRVAWLLIFAQELNTRSRSVSRETSPPSLLPSSPDISISRTPSYISPPSSFHISIL